MLALLASKLRTNSNRILNIIDLAIVERELRKNY